MAYVYRHIRLDKNVPFYIGIGLKDDGFSRAYTKLGRNYYWNNIVSLTGYEVEILFDGISKEEAYRKEKEFISIYKRVKDGGVLSNLTLGGEGQVGMIPWNFGKETPIETRKKQSLKKVGKPPPNKGKRCPQHLIDILRKANTGRPSWNKGIPLSDDRKKRHSEIMKGRQSSFKGRKHSDETKKKCGLKNIGKPSWNKGIKMTEEWKLKHPNGRKKPLK